MTPRLVRAEEAIGHRLAHDITMITKDFKGAIFRRGHVVKTEDVEILKRSGHYYVLIEDESKGEGIHEDEAVTSLARVIAGSGTYVVSAEEGKALIRSSIERGIVKVNVKGLNIINSLGDFIITTRKSYTLVNKDDIVGIVDLIPLFIDSEKYEKVLERARIVAPIVEVKKPIKTKIGLVVTGTEIYEGITKDEATSVVKSKIKMYGAEIVRRYVVPDDFNKIKKALLSCIRVSDIVIATGGMSVDPTDYTHKAIASVATEVIIYGIPVKPSTMSMLAYKGSKVIIGIPGSIVYFREWNILDILLPKLLLGEKWTRNELLELAHGGISDYFLSKKKNWR